MKAALFIPCAVELFRPEIGEAAARVLARAGARLSCPEEQTCCGQPLFKTGFFSEARLAAKHFIRTFEGADYVVAPAGSCVAMVRGYPELLSGDGAWASRARSLAESTFELSEFLVNVLRASDLGARWPALAVYHDSCQVARALGIKEEPRALLRNVAGLELIELSRSDDCCGFGGAFSLQYPEISEALVAAKAADIVASGAELVVSAEVTCLMNIDGYLRVNAPHVRAVHLAEVLARRGGRT